MLIEFLVLFALPAVFAEIPDYDSPYAPIITDKQVYTWTDKIRIKIIAPSWNADRHMIDSIGDDDHPIRITTRGHSLEPYRLAETEANSGTFAGEVTLTGFLHDADGDGRPDTTPRTAGSGPTDGFLQVDRDSGVTISFEFADGVTVSESVMVRWNVGTVVFTEEGYSPDDTVIMRVTDPDMNLNPEALDHVPILVSSDSDVAGIRIDAVETAKDSGVFVSRLHVTHDQSTSGTRLYAVPGDVIHAEYDDYTLPKPHSKSDSISIKSTAMIEPDAAGYMMTQSDISFADRSGNTISAVSPGSQIQIVGKVANEQKVTQPFVYLLQIQDESGQVVALSWITGEISAGQSLDISRSWMPEESGTYTIDTFVWDSLEGTFPLTSSLSTLISVE